MNRYKLTASTTVPLGHGWPDASTVSQHLAASLTGIVVHKISDRAYGGVRIEFDVDGGSHPETLVLLAQALANIGMEFAEAEVTEMTTRWVERALVGLLGGASLGGTSGRGDVSAIAGVIGALAGAAVGANELKVVARSQARRDWRTNEWNVTPRVIEDAPTSATGWVPA